MRVRRQVRQRRARRRMVRPVARQAGLPAGLFGDRRTSDQYTCPVEPDNGPGPHGRFGGSPGGAELPAELAFLPPKSCFLFQMIFSLFWCMV